MKSIEEGLSPLTGYLISINRNTVKGWYELQIGVPSNWIYKDNDLINCTVVKKTDAGHILTISPKSENITLDDLVAFVKLIIETNSKIREREKEFTSKMDNVKKELENQAKEFYKEIDNLREESFKKFNVNKNKTPSTDINKNNKSNDENVTTTKKRGRGRPPKKENYEQKENKQ